MVGHARPRTASVLKGCNTPSATGFAREPYGTRRREWSGLPGHHLYWPLGANPRFCHRMKQDYPLNLSISLSGGKETNQDALSNGE